MELGQYLHACAFSPAMSTFQKAVRRGHLLSWPGITNINFEKVLGTTIAAEKGHLDQERQNLQSTRVMSQSYVDDYHPKTDNGTKTYEYASIVLPFHARSTTYVDLTGRFPHRSSRGNE